jgi:hypothetical protein
MPHPIMLFKTGSRLVLAPRRPAIANSDVTIQVCVLGTAILWQGVEVGRE